MKPWIPVTALCRLVSEDMNVFNQFEGDSARRDYPEVHAAFWAPDSRRLLLYLEFRTANRSSPEMDVHDGMALTCCARAVFDSRFAIILWLLSGASYTVNCSGTKRKP